MATLIFLLTVVTLVILVCVLVTRLIRRKPSKGVLRTMGFICSGYLLLWSFFFFKSSDVTVPLGTDICFDDWCATVTQTDFGTAIQKQFSPIGTDSTWVILHVRMSNHARGIAQKPSEPRIHIMDSQNNAWPYSVSGQQLLRKISGQQPDLGQRLQLHESVTTMMVFAVPHGSKNLKVLIEEGPFITYLLLRDDRMVFTVN